MEHSYIILRTPNDYEHIIIVDRCLAGHVEHKSGIQQLFIFSARKTNVDTFILPVFVHNILMDIIIDRFVFTRVCIFQCPLVKIDVLI